MAQLTSKKRLTKTPTTKQAAVIKLLRRKSGATLADITAKTGWQPHTARGFLSGTVRKKLGLPLEVELKGDGARRYLLRSGS